MKPHRPSHHRRLIILFCMAFAACALGRAQGSNMQTPAAKQTPAPAQTIAPTVRQSVRLDVFVTDESNRFVADLRQEDFRVEEDGAPQLISFFAPEPAPMTYSLLIDSTGSLRTMFDRVLRAGETIIAGKSATDEMSMVRFVGRDQIELMRDFTRNQNALAAALDEIYVEGGMTALLEALYVTAETIVARPPGEYRRRALVVVTDGGERDPQAKLDELLKYLRRHDVQVFVFGLTDALSGDAFRKVKGGRRGARELLDTLARETGGYAVFPKKPAEFDDAALALNAQLQMPRYTLGYASQVAAGKPRKVEVKLAESARNNERKLRLRTNFRVWGAPREAIIPASK